jgi:hypothetical protein
MSELVPKPVVFKTQDGKTSFTLDMTSMPATEMSFTQKDVWYKVIKVTPVKDSYTCIIIRLSGEPE